MLARIVRIVLRHFENLKKVILKFWNDLSGKEGVKFGIRVLNIDIYPSSVGNKIL